MQDGRSVVWLNEHGRFQARVEGPVNGNILLRQAQFRAADRVETALVLSKAFIAGKLRKRLICAIWHRQNQPIRY